MAGEQVARSGRRHFLVRQQEARFPRKGEHRALQFIPCAGILIAAGFGHQLADLPVGLIDIGERAGPVEQVGCARKVVKRGVEHGLLALHFVQQALDDELIVHQGRGAVADGARVVDAGGRGRGEQGNDRGESDHQDSNQIAHPISD